MKHLKEHASKLIALSVIAVAGIAIAVTFQTQPLLADPPGNPPTANVSPTFSGLTVTGDTVIGEKGVSAPDLTILGDTFTKGHAYLGDTAADDVDIRGTLKNSAGGSASVLIDDSLQVNGDMTFGSNSFDWVNVKGKVRNDDTNAPLYLNDNVDVTGTLDTTGSVDVGNNLTIGGAVSTGSEPLTMNTDVDVAGHVSADSIGRFYNRYCPSDANCDGDRFGPGWNGTVPANSWAEMSGFCDSGHDVIACFGGFYGVGRESDKQWITQTTTVTRWFDKEGCYINGQNNKSASQSFQLVVSCWDPSG